MVKYRIVQVKPDGLLQAYIIEEFVIVPAHSVTNEKYRYMQSYYEQQSRLNIGGLPRDYKAVVPASEMWKDKGQWYYCNDLGSAQQTIKEIQLLESLKEESKTFKRKVIQEYD